MTTTVLDTPQRRSVRAGRLALAGGAAAILFAGAIAVTALVDDDSVVANSTPSRALEADSAPLQGQADLFSTQVPFSADAADRWLSAATAPIQITGCELLTSASAIEHCFEHGRGTASAGVATSPVAERIQIAGCEFLTSADAIEQCFERGWGG